jgi:hypothetical protein
MVKTEYRASVIQTDMCRYSDCENRHINFEAPVLNGEFLELLQKSEELQIALVRGHKAIGFSSIVNPSQKVVYEAVKSEPSLIFVVENPTDEMLELAFEQMLTDKEYRSNLLSYGNIFVPYSKANGDFYTWIKRDDDDDVKLCRSIKNEIKVKLFKNIIIKINSAWQSDKNYLSKFYFFVVFMPQAFGLKITEELQIFLAEHGYAYHVDGRSVDFNINILKTALDYQKKHCISSNVEDRDRVDWCGFVTLKNYPLDIQMEILEFTGFNYSSVRLFGNEILRKELAKNPKNIELISHPDISLQRFVVETDFDLIKCINNPDPEIKKIAAALKRSYNKARKVV